MECTLLVTLILVGISFVPISSGAEPQKIRNAFNRNNIHRPHQPESRDLIPQRNRRQPDETNQPQLHRRSRFHLRSFICGLLGLSFVVAGIYTRVTHDANAPSSHASSTNGLTTNSTPSEDAESISPGGILNITMIAGGGLAVIGSVVSWCVAEYTRDNQSGVRNDLLPPRYEEAVANPTPVAAHEQADDPQVGEAAQVAIQVDPQPSGEANAGVNVHHRPPPPSYESWQRSSSARREQPISESGPPSNNAIALAVQPPSSEETRESDNDGEPWSLAAVPHPPPSSPPSYASLNVHTKTVD